MQLPRAIRTQLSANSCPGPAPSRCDRDIAYTELARGIQLLGDGKHRRDLARWLDSDLRIRFGERLVPVDGETALIWGRSGAEARKSGRVLAAMDGWIAASACGTTLSRPHGMRGILVDPEWDFSIPGWMPPRKKSLEFRAFRCGSPQGGEAHGKKCHLSFTRVLTPTGRSHITPLVDDASASALPQFGVILTGQTSCRATGQEAMFP